MVVVTFFTRYGEPVTGLSPTLRIRDLSDNSLVVTDDSMLEVGDGIYKYVFAGYDPRKDYAVVVAGNDITLDSPYQYGTNDTALENQFQDQLVRLLGLSQENIRIIDTTHNASGRLTFCRYKIYENATDAENDVNEIAIYELTSTYDGTGRLMQSYKSIKQ